MRLLWIASFVFSLESFFLGPRLLGQSGELYGYPYTPEKPMAGELHFVGSTLMQQLASLWNQDFRDTHPELQAIIDCQGSESAFPQLGSAKPTVGMFSRSITSEELAEAGKRQNLSLRAITVAYDVLAVIVHPENPIDSFRWDAQRGSLWNAIGEKPIQCWSDLGVDLPLGAEAILLQLPTAEHGLRSLADRFLVADLKPDQYTAQEVEHPIDLVDVVHRHKNAIALVSATRARTSGVKAVPIRLADGQIATPFDEDGIAKGYPLVRELTLVFAVDSQGNRHPILDEFLNYSLSQRGQRIVQQDGFIPLEATMLDQQRTKLGWEVIK